MDRGDLLENYIFRASPLYKVVKPFTKFHLMKFADGASASGASNQAKSTPSQEKKKLTPFTGKWEDGPVPFNFLSRPALESIAERYGLPPDFVKGGHPTGTHWVATKGTCFVTAKTLP